MSNDSSSTFQSPSDKRNASENDRNGKSRTEFYDPFRDKKPAQKDLDERVFLPDLHR